MDEEEDVVKRFVLRLPGELHEELVEYAKAQRRSLHAQLLVLLQEAVDDWKADGENHSPKTNAGASELIPALVL